MIYKKACLTALFSLILVGCANNKTIPDYRTPQNDVKVDIAINESMCIKESGMNTADITAIRQSAQKFIEYLINKDFKNLQPYLLPVLDKSLIGKGIEEKKLDVFFGNANERLKEFHNYNIVAIYEIKTNPKSKILQGFCREEGEDISKNLFYNFADPTEESAAVLISGQQGKQKITATVLLNKLQNQWKIGFVSVYPGGVVGKSTYEITQLAATAEKDNKNEVAYLYDKLILTLTPKDPLMPEYIVNTYKSMENLQKTQINLPQLELKKGQKWLVGPNQQLIVYDVSLIPTEDKMNVLITYQPLTPDPAELEVDAPLLAQYFKITYSDIAFNFPNIIIQPLVPGADPNTPPLRKEINLNAPSK